MSLDLLYLVFGSWPSIGILVFYSDSVSSFLEASAATAPAQLSLLLGDAPEPAALMSN